MSGWVVRPVTEAERAALLDLWVAAWTPVLPKVDFAARRAWFDDYLRQLEAGGAVTLVVQVPAGESNRDVVGFVNFHPVTGYLDQLAVAPAAQGSGAAAMLLSSAKTARPAGLTLKVNQQNPRARRFYEREGFEVTGEGVSQLSGLKLWEMAWTPG